MLTLQQRELIIKLDQDGKKQEQIAQLIGCSQAAVSKWISKYKSGRTLDTLPRSGRPTQLTRIVLKRLQKKLLRAVRIANKQYCSMNTKQLSGIIKEEIGRQYSLRHVERIMHKLGFSLIKPRPKHIRQDPKKVAEFKEDFKKLEQDYLGFILVAFDEVKFQLGPSYKRIWFPQGGKPKGAFFWSSKKLLTFGALTSNHRFFYDFYDAQNSLTFRCFLRRFIKTLNRKKKYVFILDNVGYHKTQPVRNLIAEYPFISIEYLLPYLPELNPIETCWKVTKNAVTKSQYFPTIDAMQDALESFWQKHSFMQNFITYF